MTRKAPAALLLAAALAVPAAPVRGDDLVVGVSWSYFQEERWKRDEAALVARLAELGAR